MDLRQEGCLSPLGTHLSDVVSERIRTRLDVEGSMPGKRDFKLLLSKSCWAHGSDGQGEVAFARCRTPGSTLERPRDSLRTRTRNFRLPGGSGGVQHVYYLHFSLPLLWLGYWLRKRKRTGTHRSPWRENVKSKVTLRTGARTRLT